MRKEILLIAILLLNIVGLSALKARQTDVQTRNKWPVVQLTNRLGIDATVEVHDISFELEDEHDKAVLKFDGYDENQELYPGVYSIYKWERVIVLKVSEGIYTIIPLRMFQEAYEKDGLQVIKMINGQELKGRMLSVLFDSNKKPYDLRAATKVVLKDLGEAKDAVKKTKQSQPARWELQLTKPFDVKYSVVNPLFAFRYHIYSQRRFGDIGTLRFYSKYSKSFYFMLGSEENVLVDPTDFEAILFNQAVLQDGRDEKTVIKAKAKNGTETLGRIGFMPPTATSEIPKPHTYSEWYLVLVFAESDVGIILKTPVGSLQKITK